MFVLLSFRALTKDKQGNWYLPPIFSVLYVWAILVTNYLYYHLHWPATLFKYICIIYPQSGLQTNSLNIIFFMLNRISEGQKEFHFLLVEESLSGQNMNSKPTRNLSLRKSWTSVTRRISPILISNMKSPAGISISMYWDLIFWPVTDPVQLTKSG